MFRPGEFQTWRSENITWESSRSSNRYPQDHLRRYKSDSLQQTTVCACLLPKFKGAYSQESRFVARAPTPLVWEAEHCPSFWIAPSNQCLQIQSLMFSKIFVEAWMGVGNTWDGAVQPHRVCFVFRSCLLITISIGTTPSFPRLPVQLLPTPKTTQPSCPASILPSSLLKYTLHSSVLPNKLPNDLSSRPDFLGVLPQEKNFLSLVLTSMQACKLQLVGERN